MTHLEDLQEEAWWIAESNGWHDHPCSCGTDEACDECGGETDPRSRPEILALIHSEVSEALEADREGDEDLYAEELADIVIRVMDHAESENIDLEEQVERKNAINADRPYRHGGKKY